MQVLTRRTREFPTGAHILSASAELMAISSDLTSSSKFGQADGRKWYAVYTKPRHEKRVDLHCRLRDIECFCPLYKTSRRWRDGSKVILDLPLFPGYVFVRLSERIRVGVLGIPGVLAIVNGANRQLASLPDEEVAILQHGLANGGAGAEPHHLLTTGQRARIRSGAFAGMIGIVVRTKSSTRVVLTLDLIMKSIAVEVAADDLELLSYDV